MAYPRGMLDARPRERLNTLGMNREPVGGFPGGMGASFGLGQGVSGAGQAQLVHERGVTYPLTVTNVSQELIPADADRRFIFIQNNDVLGIVYVSFGGNGAIINQGFRLAPGGGGILLDNHVPTARVFMIGTIAANPNVTVVSA